MFIDLLFAWGFLNTWPSSATIRFHLTLRRGPAVVLAFFALRGLFVCAEAVASLAKV
jgi:hypothetical protein